MKASGVSFYDFCLCLCFGSGRIEAKAKGFLLYSFPIPL